MAGTLIAEASDIDSEKTNQGSYREIVEMARCLKALGIKPTMEECSELRHILAASTNQGLGLDPYSSRASWPSVD